MKYKYPCVISYAGKDITHYRHTYYFPDFPEANGAVESRHPSYSKAIPFATDWLARVISKYKEEGKPLPAPSEETNIPINEQTDKIVFIEVDV